MPEQARLVERDEFFEAIKDGSSVEGLALRKAFSVQAKAVDGEDRTIDFVISTAAIDRSKDSIAVDGWDYNAYLKSPVVLWCHDSSQPPVGKALSVSKGSDALLSRAQFMHRDLSPFADSIFRMYQEGFLSAVSVGFVPKSYSFSPDKGREFGIDFKTQELLEYSCCPVPANPEALIAARAKGIDTGPIREWASKLLDEGGHVLIPRPVLEETFRQAKTPRTVRQKYLAKVGAPDWKVGASRDLSIDDKTAWDGAAAAKRMLDDAGFDGDSPDSAKAARGFLIHDSANPALRGSYKLPFADIVGDELKAIAGGISAAKGRLDQTEAPESVLEDAQAVIDHYESKEGNDDDSDSKDVIVVETKSGRRINAANEALLRKAMDHHESATKCIKDVLNSNSAYDEDMSDDDNDDDGDDDNTSFQVVEPPLDARAQRLAEVKALRASIKP